jgi:hypothetical protein
LNIDRFIRTNLQIEDESKIDLYNNYNFNLEKRSQINQIINSNIEQITPSHDPDKELFLKENGYVILDNFLSETEADKILELTKDVPGYNYHIAAKSYNRKTAVFNDELDWNIMSYEPSLLFQSHVLMDKINQSSLLSLVQSYLGCFPTIYSLNCMWSKFTSEPFKTQLIHRDYDDFKFLSLFIYLTDVDENNGPHIYYPKTHKGTEPLDKPVTITGRKGTAFLADPYGLHHGIPLKEGKRCFLWCRFGLMLNNMYYKDNNYLFKVDENQIFDKIDDNVHNRFLFRGFII